MRRSKTNSLDPINISDGDQQFRKREPPRRIAPRVHVLPQQLNVGITLIGHSPRLYQHRSRGARALLAARVRHNAVGTKLVASLDNRDVSAMRIRANCELRIEGLVRLPVIEPRDARLPCL